MARRASGECSFKVAIREENDSLGVGDGIARIDHNLSQIVSLSSGTANGQIDRVWSGSGTASSTPTDLDMVSLTSLVGAGTTTLVEVALIAVRNTGSTELLVGGDGNSFLFLEAAADRIRVAPGGFLVLYSPPGFTTTDSTADILQLATASSTTTYQIVIAGRSA